MVVMTNTTDPQRVYIPKVMGKSIPLESGVLTLVSTADHREYTFAVIDMSYSGLYYVVSVSLEDGMPAGEYEYTLMSGLEFASTGLAVIQSEVETEDYEQTIQYEQYQ